LAVVIGYWLLVIGYWLLVIGYWLLVIRSALPFDYAQEWFDFAHQPPRSVALSPSTSLRAPQLTTDY
jgi:hypothetical protein